MTLIADRERVLEDLKSETPITRFLYVNLRQAATESFQNDIKSLHQHDKLASFAVEEGKQSFDLNKVSISTFTIHLYSALCNSTTGTAFARTILEVGPISFSVSINSVDCINQNYFQRYA